MQCGFCGERVEKIAEAVCCSECGENYHKDCWPPSGACRRSDCGSRRYEEVGGISVRALSGKVGGSDFLVDTSSRDCLPTKLDVDTYTKIRAATLITSILGALIICVVTLILNYPIFYEIFVVSNPLSMIAMYALLGFVGGLGSLILATAKDFRWFLLSVIFGGIAVIFSTYNFLTTPFAFFAYVLALALGCQAVSLLIDMKFNAKWKSSISRLIFVCTMFVFANEIITSSIKGQTIGMITRFLSVAIGFLTVWLPTEWAVILSTIGAGRDAIGIKKINRQK